MRQQTDPGTTAPHAEERRGLLAVREEDVGREARDPCPGSTAAHHFERSAGGQVDADEGPMVPSQRGGSRGSGGDRIREERVRGHVQDICAPQPGRPDLLRLERVGDAALRDEGPFAAIVDERDEAPGVPRMAHRMDADPVGGQRAGEPSPERIAAQAGDERGATAEVRERRGDVRGGATASEDDPRGHVGAPLDRSGEGGHDIEKQIPECHEVGHPSGRPGRQAHVGAGVMTRPGAP